jgi:hypothetical protein
MILVRVSLLKRGAVLHRGQKSLMTRQRTFIGDHAFQIASGQHEMICDCEGGVQRAIGVPEALNSQAERCSYVRFPGQKEV